jgi:hypothetical protein
MIDLAFDNLSGFVDDQTHASILVKKRKAIAPRILVDAALTATRDPALAHQRLNERCPDPKALGDQRRVHTERLTIELDPIVP